MNTEQVSQPLPMQLRPRGDDPSSWVYLADLPLSDVEVQAVDAFCREHRLASQERLMLLDCSRFTRYFNGQFIATMHSPRGRVVLMADHEYTPQFSQFIRNLPEELRGKVALDCIRDPNESTIIG